MIYRIIDGKKVLFADISKVDTVNGKSADDQKNIEINSLDIDHNQTTVKEELEKQEGLLGGLRTDVTTVQTKLEETTKIAKEAKNTAASALGEASKATELATRSHERIDVIDPVLASTTEKANIADSNAITALSNITVLDGRVAVTERDSAKALTDAETANNNAVTARSKADEALSKLNIIEPSYISRINNTVFRKPGDITGNVVLTGTDIPININTNERLGSAIENLKAKTKLYSTEEKLLTWREDGIYSTLQVRINNGNIQLLGDNSKIISETALDLQSDILGAFVSVWDGQKWVYIPTNYEWLTIEEIERLNKASTDFGVAVNNQYLILAFKDTNDEVSYAFADLSRIVKPISAGIGIAVVNGDNNVGYEVSVKKDPQTAKELDVTPYGIKYTHLTKTKDEWDKLTPTEGNTDLDGVYYVTE